MLSNVLFYARLLLIGVILGGPDLLRTVGINQNPQLLQWMFDNKVGSLWKNGGLKIVYSPYPSFPCPCTYPYGWSYYSVKSNEALVCCLYYTNVARVSFTE